MRERIGNIWLLLGIADAICVTTNGVVKPNGALVMGAGIALEARTRFPKIQYELGERVLKLGNIPTIGWTEGKTSIVSFPTKDHYSMPSNMFLIEKSAKILREMADLLSWKDIALPRPGCGFGRLEWKNVRNILEPIFDDRFIICSRT